ncbi:hypothetical protein J437_LFUL018579 [Ladona fulva]|uniref:Uncharacterized protein n=1 Tax=Ladona fulva TaxID=123851 RepID=A0A8K0KRY0_LADFU|nr:hypothetical protein J437_LFUL018579 [Ladona fulva]
MTISSQKNPCSVCDVNVLGTQKISVGWHTTVSNVETLIQPQNVRNRRKISPDASTAMRTTQPAIEDALLSQPLSSHYKIKPDQPPLQFINPNSRHSHPTPIARSQFPSLPSNSYSQILSSPKPIQSQQPTPTIPNPPTTPDSEDIIFWTINIINIVKNLKSIQEKKCSY